MRLTVFESEVKNKSQVFTCKSKLSLSVLANSSDFSHIFNKNWKKTRKKFKPDNNISWGLEKQVDI